MLVAAEPPILHACVIVNLSIVTPFVVLYKQEDLLPVSLQMSAPVSPFLPCDSEYVFLK